MLLLVESSERARRKQHIYCKYANLYTNDEGVLKEMIRRANEMNENSCILFDENSDDTYGITADDLEEIFQSSNKKRSSLSRIVSSQLNNNEFRHILKTRAAHTIGLIDTTVNVRYFLVWQKEKDY